MVVVIAGGMSHADAQLLPNFDPQLMAQRPAFHPLQFDFTAPGATDYHQNWTGDWGTPTPNPWLHSRLVGRFTLLPNGPSYLVPGFFNGDGTTEQNDALAQGSTTERAAGIGRVWSLRFAAPRNGLWELDAYWEEGQSINVHDLWSSPPPCSQSTVACSLGTRFTALPRDAKAGGFMGKGFLRADDTSGVPYLRFVRYRPNGTTTGPYFIKAGLGSPENLFGYMGFSGLHLANQDPGGGTDGPADFAMGFVHDYKTVYPLVGASTSTLTRDHKGNWRPSMPDWPANGVDNQGQALIGALAYVSSLGLNAIYFLPMNLGGDGRDTHPFADLTPVSHPNTGVSYPHTRESDEQVRIYDVKRMREWNVALEFCMQRGLMADIVLAEQEYNNMNYLADGPRASSNPQVLGISRKLFLKNMVAMFGHNVAIQWTICEDNAVPGDNTFLPEFDYDAIEDIAQWIRMWDAFDHPVTVHPRPRLGAGNGGFGPNLFKELVEPSSPSDPDGRGQWLRLVSLYTAAEGDGAPPGNWNALDYDNYSQDCEEVLAEHGAPGVAGWGYDTLGIRPIPTIDEHGSWRLGIRPREEDILEGQPSMAQVLNFPTVSHQVGSRTDCRQRILYPTLFSGGGLSWYFGWDDGTSETFHGEFGGQDLECDHFGARSSIFKDTKIAASLIHEYINLAKSVPADGDLSGASTPVLAAKPEVLHQPFGSNGRGFTYLVYYAKAHDGSQYHSLGQLPLPQSTVYPWGWKFISPTDGTTYGSGYLSNDASGNPPSMVDVTTQISLTPIDPSVVDLVFVVYSVQPSEEF